MRWAIGIIIAGSAAQITALFFSLSALCDGRAAQQSVPALQGLHRVPTVAGVPMIPAHANAHHRRVDLDEHQFVVVVPGAATLVCHGADHAQ